MDASLFGWLLSRIKRVGDEEIDSKEHLSEPEYLNSFVFLELVGGIDICANVRMKEAQIMVIVGHIGLTSRLVSLDSGPFDPSSRIPVVPHLRDLPIPVSLDPRVSSFSAFGLKYFQLDENLKVRRICLERVCERKSCRRVLATAVFPKNGGASN